MTIETFSRQNDACTKINICNVLLLHCSNGIEYSVTYGNDRVHNYYRVGKLSQFHVCMYQDSSPNGQASPPTLIDFVSATFYHKQVIIL